MNNYKIIYETIAGSFLYGTNTLSSDIDWRGIALEPRESLIGLSPFEQHEDTSNKQDRVIYGLRKFVNLALGQNPNVIELLFAPVTDYLHISPRVYTMEWMEIVQSREYFLSRKVADTFVGYAVSQLKRMETHYKWMREKPPEKPDPQRYGYLISSSNPPAHVWVDSNLKQKYDADLKHYQQYLTWLENRNKTRHELEDKFGYDTKNAMHLVRLLQQGEELLLTGNLKLPRPNAKDLLDIRNGGLTYGEVLDFMDEKRELIEKIKEDSVLPTHPHFNKVEQLVMRINEEYLNE